MAQVVVFEVNRSVGRRPPLEQVRNIPKEPPQQGAILGRVQLAELCDNEGSYRGGVVKINVGEHTRGLEASV